MSRSTWRHAGVGWSVAVVVLAVLTAGMGRTQGDAAKALFEAVDIAKVDVTPKQARILERIQKSKVRVGDVHVVRVAKEALPTADTLPPLKVMLGPAKEMNIKNYRVQMVDSKVRLAWSAKPINGKEVGDLCVLSVSDKNATGLIYAGDKVYSVRPLGGGLQAITQIDQSKFEEHHKDKEHIARKTTAKLADTKPPAAGPAVLRVLVGYTKKVDDNDDVDNLIDASINITNESFINSKVNAKVELAHAFKVKYSESNSQEKDLDRWTGNGDGFMDEVHALRDKHAADICVLLINNDEACGWAAAILADAPSAFCVVHFECAVDNLSFAHEIGHLLGARHDWEHDSTLDPAHPYNHGYYSTMGSWRTIMAYPKKGKPNRIPYWSNPSVSHGSPSEPTGTAAKHDNARMLNLAAPTAAKFRP